MSNNDILLKLKQDLVDLQNKISTARDKDAYVGNENLTEFYQLISGIDDLNNNAKLSNLLQNEFNFYSINAVEKYLEFEGFSRKNMLDINESYNLEDLNTDEAPALVRNIDYTKIQKKIDYLKLNFAEQYVLFDKKKRIIEEISNKKLEKIIKELIPKI